MVNRPISTPMMRPSSAPAENLGLESLPVVTQMDFGYTDAMFVIPYG
jgi:hypothetical protein